jgi:two-component sensor histidine kinase
MAEMVDGGASPAPRDAQFIAVLPHVVESVGDARRMLRQDLAARGVPVAVVQDATVVLSELVANSLRHAAPTGDGGVRVSWTVGSDRLVLRVTDGGGASAPAETSAAEGATGGRGLSIVRHLTTTWGWTEEDHAVTVHAELPLDDRSDRERA